MNSVITYLDVASNRLGTMSDTPELDAQVLVSSVLQKPRSWLLAHPEVVLDPAQQDAVENSLRRLENGEPLPYVIGCWEFFGLIFDVTPDVLIPRPETELLVEFGIKWLREKVGIGKTPRVLDIGTGCGCIAISLIKNVPGIHVDATDISHPALEIAQNNGRRLLGADCIHFLVTDLFPDKNAAGVNNLPLHYDLIISNPPYIPTDKLRTLPIFGHEPVLALDGGDDGLAIMRRILDQAPEHLASDGLILIEIEASQGSAVRALSASRFPRRTIRVHQDLSGRDRLLEIHNRPEVPPS